MHEVGEIFDEKLRYILQFLPLFTTDPKKDLEIGCLLILTDLLKLFLIFVFIREIR